MFGKYERVLIVDDCELQRRLLKKELRSRGYNVQTAQDGVEALRMVKDQDFDFVITDWDMPNLDGELLCRCLRSQLKSDRYLYIIMLTSKTDVSDVVSSFAAGVDDFITKPVNTTELLARMGAGDRVLTHERRLAYFAERDPLTGLLNRRSLIPRISNLYDDCQKYGRDMACVLFDISNFRDVNERYGMQAGDEALVAIANQLTQCFRASDDIFRFSGDKFLIILPSTTGESARVCAERCQRNIAEFNYLSIGIEEPIVANFGVSKLGNNLGSATDLLDQVQAALANAKKTAKSEGNLALANVNGIKLSQPTQSLH